MGTIRVKVGDVIRKSDSGWTGRVRAIHAVNADDVQPRCRVELENAASSTSYAGRLLKNGDASMTGFEHVEPTPGGVA